MTDESARDEILRLKRAKDALILVHNYQVPEVQEIGDSVGDSLELARKAVEARKPLIVFCGVRFMAETAKILNPQAKVLLPRQDAGCPMADMVSAEDVVQARREHPGAVVCSYVNTSACLLYTS
ncbi:MAG: quinolinate synthase NadA, partial [bacterium]